MLSPAGRPSPPGSRSASADGTALQLNLVPCEGEVRRAMAAVRDALQGWEVDPLTAGAVEIVLAEVLNNIVEHAYADRMSGEILVWMERRPGDLAIAVIDDGRPMPGGTIPDPKEPDLDVSTADLPEGGFGWGLIRTLSSSLSYRRMSERNRLAFRIPLPNPQTDDP